MKKILLLLMAFLFSAITWNVFAQDPIFTKIETANLKKELQQNNKNPEKLVELIRQSIESKQIEVAYQTLNEMRLTQPNNAVVLAAYAMAYDASLYQVRKRTGVIRSRTPQEKREYESTLKKAKQLSPKLWLPYTIEGFRLAYTPPWKYDEGLDLLHKAIQLAPRAAFAHKQFAQALNLAANNKRKWQEKTVTHEQAAAQYEIAYKLNPNSADVAFALFTVYDIDLKDKRKATQAKRAFLKTLPPNYNLSKSVRERLAQYPD